MAENLNNTRAIILAAGEGKRMKSTLPKVMHIFKDKPLVEHVVAAVEGAGLGKPIVVVSAKHDQVQEYLGDRADYVVQHEQLGTGHAVSTVLFSKSELVKNFKNILVVPADLPLISPKTIKSLVDAHVEKNVQATFATIEVPSFEGRNVGFNDFGRIVNENKRFKIVEYKDATEAQRKVRVLNAGLYCFTNVSLPRFIDMIEQNNTQKEYYLTDVIASMSSFAQPVAEYRIQNSNEALGVNSQEQLRILETL